MNSEHEHDIHSQLKSISASLKDLNKSIAQVEKNTRALDQEESNVSRKEGELIQVSLRISFLGIEDIDTVKQEFTCEFFLAATWREPSLTGKTVDDEIDWDREWDPEITFANAVELRSLKKKHDVSFENQVQETHRDGRHSIGSDEEDNQSHDGTPIVQLSYRVKGRFKSILDLKNFPFDFQTLNIVISSNWSDGVLVFECENVESCSVPACQRFPNQEEWHLVNHVMCTVDSFEEEYSEFPISFSVCTFKVQIHRKYSYFINNIVILMFIITLLSFVSFAVDSSETGEKLSVSLTLLLTSVAFKFVVTSSLPPVSYMTILDRYILGSLLFIFLITVDNSLASWVKKKTKSNNFEWYSLYVAIVLFVLMHIYFLWLSVRAVLVAARNKAKAKNKQFRWDRFLRMHSMSLPGTIHHKDHKKYKKPSSRTASFLWAKTIKRARIGKKRKKKTTLKYETQRSCILPQRETHLSSLV